MNYLLLIFTYFVIAMSSNVLAEPIPSCSVPLSRSFHTVEVVMAPHEPALPPAFTQATRISGAITTTGSMLAGVGTTQMAQGARAFSALQIVSCKSGSTPDAEVPDWADSPTQLAVGDNAFQYDLGAIIGNWAVLAGISTAWAGVAYKYGAQNVNFPGGLIMPVLFLLGGTTTSTFNLFHYGTGGQRAWSGCLIALQTIGMGAVTVNLHPKFFKAKWVDEDWADTTVPGFVGRYGMLFEDYRDGRQWYLDAELLMTLATGILKSYKATEEDCARVVLGAAAIYSTYALSLATLTPNAERKERIFFGAIAGIEALALSLQAISLAVASEETQDKTRTVSESIVAAAEWALMIKSMLDIASNIRSAVGCFCSKPGEHQAFSESLLTAVNIPGSRRRTRANVNLADIGDSSQPVELLKMVKGALDSPRSPSENVLSKLRKHNRFLERSGAVPKGTYTEEDLKKRAGIIAALNGAGTKVWTAIAKNRRSPGTP